MSAAGRVVEVEADRLPGWLERFAARHGPVTAAGEPAPGSGGVSRLILLAADGARAELDVPYGPLDIAADQAAEPAVAGLVEHLQRDRTLALLLVRRGGWAAGVVREGRLVESAVGGGHVQGRTKAGGWSQQRYARRRSQQSQQVWDRARDGAATVLLPHRGELSALVTGGDRSGVTTVLADPRLVALRPMVAPRFLAVPDPTRSVLDDAVRRLGTIVITLNDRA